MFGLSNHPVIWHVFRRVNKSKLIDQVIIATSTESADDVIEKFCISNKFNFFRGSEDDVLDRFNKAARIFNADIVIRITADCPLIDPNIIDDVLHNHMINDFDVSGLAGDFPDGLDVEVFKQEALDIASRESNLRSEREHIGQYFYKRPEQFKLGSFSAFKDKGQYRWTLDEQEDYELIVKIYDHLYHEDKMFHTNDIFLLMEKYPELQDINSEIIRNEGLLKSLEND
jgi:spore coat polysaccharide biosynthesis protein SpsF (cytidylyltransferase family)